MNKFYVLYNKVTEQYYGTGGDWTKTPRTYSSMRNLTASILQKMDNITWGKDNDIENMVILEISPIIQGEISLKDYYEEKKRIAEEKRIKREEKEAINYEKIRKLEDELRKLRRY